MKARNAYIQGAGRLEFNSLSPSGLGRQVLIPFYLENTVTGFQVLSPTGLVNNSTSSPNVLITPVVNGGTNIAQLRTPQISWSVLRMVGFVTNIYQPSIPSIAPLDVCFSDLKVGGGATLFVHEDFGSGTMYETDNQNPGLRDYPLVLSPNRVEVSVQGMGLTSAIGTQFSCAILCDILQDDEYGLHVPGPYARKGAIQKKR
jgi:hypothetical protein